MDTTPITYEQVLLLFAETSRKMAETDKRIADSREEMAASQKKTEEEMAASYKETQKALKALAKQVGEITDTMGRFAQAQVAPRILKMFKAEGIEMGEICEGVRFKKDGKIVAEADLLLLNGIYSVIVEVKHTLRQKDIGEHLDRLEKLQTLESRLIKGTSMFGAVAGMIMTDETEKYAEKMGLYVIKPKGDGVEIRNKKGFKPKKWEALK